MAQYFNKIMKKNLGLNEKQFNELVSRLKKGDDALFELAYKKLVEDNIELLKNRYKIEDFDAKDATLNALFSLKKKLLDGKIRYDNIRFIFSKMAYHEYILLMRARERSLNPEGKVISIYTKDGEGSLEFTEDDFESLKIAMSKLDKICLKIIKSVFYTQLKLKEIAAVLKMSYDNIRKKKQRCLEKLTGIMMKN